MRRLVCALCFLATLAGGSSAQAHTLTMGLAVAKARGYAATLGAQNWPSQRVATQVTGCARLNSHAVNCRFFMVAEGNPVAHSYFRCDGAVQVYYLGQRSRYRYTRPLGILQCGPV